MLELLSKIPTDENDLLQFSIDELARIGVKRILAQALCLEVADYLEQAKNHVDEKGRKLVVRNGKAKPRKVTFGSGAIEIQVPRVNDKRPGISFTSKILPPYLRKSPNLESVLPILYLKGLSGNAFQEALVSLLGEEGVKGLSPASICSLKKSWQQELREWSKRPIKDDFAYLWCDGVNVSVRLGEEKKICLLVVVGVDQDGKKKLLSVSSGYRESELGWKEVFNSLIERGINSPQLIIGDGALGLWSAIGDMEHFKNTKQQRCWVHKIANVLDKLPKSTHAQAKDFLHEMMRAPSRSEANTQLKLFKDVFEAKYPKAYETLNKDWKKMTTFFDFPASHWISIRTSNPIESAFATVKLRTTVTKGAGNSSMAEAMAFKLLREAEKKWRKIRGHELVKDLLQGAVYIDGELDVKRLGQQVVA